MGAIRPGEVARNRAAFERDFLPDTGAIRTRQPGTRAEDGTTDDDPDEDAADWPSTTVRCGMAPLTGGGASVQAAIAMKADGVLHVPVATAVNPNDRVEWGGGTYTVLAVRRGSRRWLLDLIVRQIK